MEKILPLEEIKALIGQEVGKSEWMRIDQNRIDRFADCTEDRQWIHVDTVKATGGPYGRAVAHGFLTLALIPHLSRNMTFAPSGAPLIVNYGLNKVRFIKPVPAGAMIRDTMILKAVEEKGKGKILMTMEHTVEIQGETQPACVVETLRLFVQDTARESDRA